MKQDKRPRGNLANQQILRLIWNYGPVSRVELGRLSGYSKSTITKNCDAMISQGIIREEAILKEGTTSKRTNIAINSDYGYVAGVELGAVYCYAGICNFLGDLVSKEAFKIDYNSGPEIILNKIIASIHKQLQKMKIKTLLGIGIGLPSPVDFERGVAVHPSFMPGWHNYPTRRYIEERTGCKVWVDNEVHAMALGEDHISDDLKSSNLLFIKADYGIGSGILIDGNIFRGSSGMGGNIGHVTIESNKTLCKCGKHGCLESIVGEEALARWAEKELKGGTASLLLEPYKSKGFLTVKDINKAFYGGDKLCSDIVTKAGRILGRTIGKMVIFFDPDSVIIGGSISDFGPLMISNIYQGILEESGQWLSRDFVIRKSLKPKEVGMIGACILCIAQLIQNEILSE